MRYTGNPSLQEMNDDYTIIDFLLTSVTYLTSKKAIIVNFVGKVMVTFVFDCYGAVYQYTVYITATE